MSWNVGANAGPWEARYARIEQLMRGMDADIVGMQEVWRAVGHEPVADRVAPGLDLHTLHRVVRTSGARERHRGALAMAGH